MGKQGNKERKWKKAATEGFLEPVVLVNSRLGGFTYKGLRDEWILKVLKNYVTASGGGGGG